MRSLLFTVLLALVAFAGCLAGDDGPEFRDDWAAHAMPYGGDHDHYDPLHHQDLSTPNFELLGYDPLLSEYLGRTAAGHLCGDAGTDGQRVLGVVHAYSDDVLFTVLDLTDPADPHVLGEVVAPNAPGRDVALTEDGRYVAVAMGPTPVPPTLPSSLAELAGPAVEGLQGVHEAAPMTFRDRCGDERPIAMAEPDFTPGLPGVWLFDLADPTEPVMVDQFVIPSIGTHSVTTGELDGTQVVVASITNLASGASNFWFFTVGDGPTGPLQFHSLYQDRADEGNAPLINGHTDAWVQVHPGTGQHLAYLANWNQGMIILDVGDLSDPQPIGRWYDNPGPNADIQSDGTGSVHEAFPIPELWDGHHYTLIGQEILNRPSATPSGWIRVLETTDPTSPTVVAEWTLPVDVVWDESLVWSTHYLDVWERTMFVAHYHAGIWAVDLSGLPDVDQPPAIGVFVPANASPAPPPAEAPYDWAPTVMEMNVLPSGDIVVWDSASGAYVVRFDAEHPAPPAVWTG